MSNITLGVGHPETLELPNEMLVQVEHEAKKAGKTSAEWILQALREKFVKSESAPQ